MKYLWAFSIPVIGIMGIYMQGIWTYAAFVYAFVVIPILELMLPTNEENYSEKEIDSRLKNKIFDILLYLNIPIVAISIIVSLQKVVYSDISLYEMIGTIVSLGVILGSNGINVAHELGHRDKLYERIMGKILLIPSHYTHFFIEHNHGHHLHVSTPDDPSTAKYNQNLYAFWWQTVSGTYIKAWQIQKKLNQIENRKIYSIKNDMFWYTIIQISYLVITYLIFDIKGLILVFFAGIVGFLLLETINYIEHYGLKRSLLPSGRFERVTEKHSWNSNHVLGRIILYELTRHSDHHYKSQKKYQILEYHDVSPQMPYGYPTSMVMSFFPPLWFAVMNKRVPQEMKVK
jgi:alkane 1-monooxygenase